MVVAKESVSYPMLSTNAWWAIRKKFIQSMPQRVTDTYLASLLSIEARSAKNLLPPLKRMGLLDSDGKPTERAARWRDNEQYASVCEEIRQEIYPHELLDLFPSPDSPRPSIENWFASRAGVGAAAKRAMALPYLLLAEADYTKQDNGNSVKPASKKLSMPKSTIQGVKAEKRDKAVSDLSTPTNDLEIPRTPERHNKQIRPSLHVDIQIHIASDAPSDQIDHIFASMAKYLYNREEVNE